MPQYIVTLPLRVVADNPEAAARNALTELGLELRWAVEVQEVDSAFTPIDPPILLNGEEL